MILVCPIRTRSLRRIVAIALALLVATPEVALARQRELLERFQGHPLAVPAVAAHSPYSVSAANLAKEAELADEFGAPLIIHLAETR